MSGSSGGGGGGGVGGGGGRELPPGKPDDNCDKLDVPTLLNSPVPKVVATLKKGDQLDVVLKKTGNLARLEAVDAQGKVAGSLTPNELLQIVRCIENGHEYVAILTADPAGGATKLRIQSKKKKP
jgi:hypothetical protein